MEAKKAISQQEVSTKPQLAEKNPAKKLSLPRRVMLAALTAFSLTGCASPIAKTLEVSDSQAKAMCDFRNQNFFPYQQQNGIEVYAKGNSQGFITPGYDSPIYIYTRDLNTGEIKNLNITGTNPALSPDGKKIAYRSFDKDKEGKIESGIFVANIDGSNSSMIYRESQIDGEQVDEINWSPQGSLISFVRKFHNYYSEEPDWQIGLTSPDGQTQQSFNPGKNIHHINGLVWSSDGKALAFSGSKKDGSDSDIFALPYVDIEPTVNKTNRISWGSTNQLTGKSLIHMGGNTDHLPQWSRDGQSITFLRDSSNKEQIIAVSADGSKEADITSACK